MPPPLVRDDEVFALSDSEMRFREACQFYVLYLAHGGPAAAPTGNRFLWVCYADAFLIAMATLKDLTPHKAALNADDRYRVIVTLRNLTVHSIVAGSPGAGGVISRDVYASVAGSGRDDEDPVIDAGKLASCLSTYEARLKAEPVGRGRTRWDAERKNIEAAKRWNAGLAAANPSRQLLSELFHNTIQLVAATCGFTVPPLT
jgi:hypothetical protein